MEKGSPYAHEREFEDDASERSRYALGVYNELCMALGGLVEEGEIQSFFSYFSFQLVF